MHINIHIYVIWWGAHWSVTTCISVQNVTCSHKVGSNKKTIGGLSGTYIRIPPAWPHSHMTCLLTKLGRTCQAHCKHLNPDHAAMLLVQVPHALDHKPIVRSCLHYGQVCTLDTTVSMQSKEADIVHAVPMQQSPNERACQCLQMSLFDLNHVFLILRKPWVHPMLRIPDPKHIS